MSELVQPRIAASGIVVRDGKVLLVRYGGKDGKSFLVGPGGGANIDEDLREAVVREIKEETGYDTVAGPMVFVDDLLSRRYRMLKFWFLCNVIGGELLETDAAKVEGISQVAWYTKEQLEHETVYPAFLKSCDWAELAGNARVVAYSGLVRADF